MVSPLVLLLAGIGLCITKHPWGLCASPDRIAIESTDPRDSAPDIPYIRESWQIG